MNSDLSDFKTSVSHHTLCVFPLESKVGPPTPPYTPHKFRGDTKGHVPRPGLSERRGPAEEGCGKQLGPGQAPYLGRDHIKASSSTTHRKTI